MELGFRQMIFGSGYSSFNLMKTLDFDCIKIDQSFIRNILVQPADQIMVSRSLIVQMLWRIGLHGMK